MPTWVKSGVWGIILGSILTMVLGFGYAGWTTKSTVERLSAQRADAAVTAALVPVCLARSKSDNASVKRLGELRAITSSYEQQEFVTKIGWAEVPGTDTSSRDLAEACASALIKATSAK